MKRSSALYPFLSCSDPLTSLSCLGIWMDMQSFTGNQSFWAIILTQVIGFPAILKKALIRTLPSFVCVYMFYFYFFVVGGGGSGCGGVRNRIINHLVLSSCNFFKFANYGVM